MSADSGPAPGRAGNLPLDPAIIAAELYPSARDRAEELLGIVDTSPDPAARAKAFTDLDRLPQFNLAGAMMRQTGPGLDPDEVSEATPAKPPSYLTSAADFLSVEDPPLSYVVGELVPAGCTLLWHGEPRVRKSWAGLELAIAGVTGTPAFGLERFKVTNPVPVVYSSQEDAAPRVRDRLRKLLAGRGLDRVPELLYLSVHAGIDLEDRASQDRLRADVLRIGAKLVIFDPIRRFALSADKGPSDVQRVTAVLRRLASDTGAAIGTLHHDVKPPRDGRDDRRRSHLASGGDWFAASDCPVSLETAGPVTVVTPSDFKFGQDPRPFRFRVVEAGAGLLVVGEDVASGTDARDLALQERILDFLVSHPRVTKHHVELGVKARGVDVRDALSALLAEGKVDSVSGPRNSTFWWVSAS